MKEKRALQQIDADTAKVIANFPIISQLYALFLEQSAKEKEKKDQERYDFVSTAKKKISREIRKIRQTPPQMHPERHVVEQALLQGSSKFNIPSMLSELLAFHDIFEDSSRLIPRNTFAINKDRHTGTVLSKKWRSLDNIEHLIEGHYHKKMDTCYIEEWKKAIALKRKEISTNTY